MAIGVLSTFRVPTQAQYDEAVKKLDERRHPTVAVRLAGQRSAVACCWSTPNGWRVMDVWESEADLMTFAEILMPIIKAVGFPESSPQIFPAHNLVKG